MKKSMQVFLTDMKKLGTNWVAAILIGGLVILPSLYAWLNIDAQWDPYGQTDEIPVGVVNEDSGATVRDEDIDIGDELVDTLKENDDLDWRFVDRDEAMDKVEYGDYFAVIVIPEDFSDNLGSVVKGDPEKGKVEYYVNEKINAIAPKITEKGAGTIVDQISSHFISTVNGVIFDMFNELGLEIEEDLPDIKQFEDYIFTLEDNLPDINDTLHDTLSDANDAGDIIDKAEKRMPDVKDTTDSGLETIDDTTSFLDNAEDRLDEIAPEIEDDLETVASIADDANGFIEDILASDIDFSEGEHLTDKLDGRIDDAFTMIETIEGSLEELQAQNQEGPTDERTESESEGNDADTNDDHALDNPEAIDDALEELGVLKGDLKEIQNNLHKVDDFVGDKKEEVDDVFNDLHELTANTSERIGDFVKEYKESIEPRVFSEVSKAKDTLDNARGILADIQSTIPEVEDLLSSSDENLGDGKETLEDVLDEFPYVKEKVNDLADRIRDVQSETNIGEIIELLKNDPEAEQGFFSEPVELNENQVFPIENYGTGMTPFYTALAIWVGALLLMSLLAFEVKGREDLSGRQVYFGRFLTFMVIGLLQTIIVTTGDVLLIGVSVQSMLWFIVFGLVISIVFMLIVYSLVSVFGDVGKALAIVLLVLQIAGSGGTYPIAVLPEFYQTVSPFLPFTYAVDLLREAVGGIVWERALKDLAFLGLFGVIAVVFGAFLKAPLNKQTGKLKKKSDESGLFH